MSALQLQTGSRIAEAMGWMINDDNMVSNVIDYITALKNKYPTISKAYLEANTISAEDMISDLQNMVNDCA